MPNPALYIDKLDNVFEDRANYYKELNQQSLGSESKLKENKMTTGEAKDFIDKINNQTMYNLSLDELSIIVEEAFQYGLDIPITDDTISHYYNDTLKEYFETQI